MRSLCDKQNYKTIMLGHILCICLSIVFLFLTEKVGGYLLLEVDFFDLVLIYCRPYFNIVIIAIFPPLFSALLAVIVGRKYGLIFLHYLVAVICCSIWRFILLVKVNKLYVIVADMSSESFLFLVALEVIAVFSQIFIGKAIIGKNRSVLVNRT